MSGTVSRYWDGVQWWPSAAEPVDCTAISPNSVATTTTLASDKTSIDSGASITLTGDTTATTGNIQFEYESATPGTWTALGASLPVNTSGIATKTDTPPVGTRKYRCRYLGSGNWLVSTSGQVLVTTAQISTNVVLADIAGITYGGSFSLSATVTRTVGATAVTVGQLQFQYQSGSSWLDIGTPLTPNASGVAATTWAAPGAGTYSFQCVYIPPSDYLASVSTTKSATAAKITTSIACSVTDADFNNGTSITLKGDGSPSFVGTITFDWSSNNSAWTAISAHTTDANTYAARTETPTSSRYYRARLAEATNYLGSTSGSVYVTVRQLTTVTWSSNADWSMTYDGDNTQRDNTQLWYGYYSSSHGNHRALIGFPVPASTLKSCYDITSVRVKFYNEHHYLNSGGHINIGTHMCDGMPATWPDTSVDQNLYDFGSAPKPGWVDLTLTSQMQAYFKAGNRFGIALGPGPSTSSNYYGYATSHTGTNKPWLEIKYRVWS